MRVVQEKFKTLKHILPVQEIDPEAKYRPLTFCTFMTVDGTDIVYNAMTGELVELDSEEKTKVQIEVVEYSDDIEFWVENWFLVPVDHDDMGLADEISSFMQVFEKTSGISIYTVFTTMDCNARCFYCYEAGRPRVTMTAETAEGVVEFIKKNAPKSKKVTISWFGGEPLCNTEVIESILDGIAEAGIMYQSRITTNAYLFDEQLAERAAKKWNLVSAQITLDGTEKVYNKVKAYVGSEGVNAFERVTDNIEYLLKNGVQVFVRLNLGTHNRQDLYDLCDWLAVRYKGYENFCVYPFLLFEVCTVDTKLDLRAAMTNDLFELEQHCEKLGILETPIVKSRVRYRNCMADNPRSIGITARGDLTKCEHYTENELVGNVWEGITDHEKVKEFARRENSRELCADCPAYPTCVKLEVCSSWKKSKCDYYNRMVEVKHFYDRVKNTYRWVKQKNKAE